MGLNFEKFNNLFHEKGKSNYNYFAKVLNINVSQLYKVINKKSEPGIKFYNKLAKYCKKNSLNLIDFIFFK